jgi:hypothetical protein
MFFREICFRFASGAIIPVAVLKDAWIIEEYTIDKIAIPTGFHIKKLIT